MPLRSIFWDYNFTDTELNELLNGRRKSLGTLTRPALLARMFEYMNWFDIVQHLDRNFFLSFVTPEFIDGLKEKDLREGLAFVRDFLLRDSLSAAG
ncbi:MAG: hypothetical protein KGJ59_14360 [Bacteroidota bacterium]|nr:hypothetical protein [Bacteroidota bacterium]